MAQGVKKAGSMALAVIPELPGDEEDERHRLEEMAEAAEERRRLEEVEVELLEQRARRIGS